VLHILPDIVKQMTTPMFVMKTGIAVAMVGIVIARPVLRGGGE
jgi:hypothetical protein